MADVSAERVHDGILAREMLARDAALLTDTVREAGALALSLFRTELKNWTKGASSPVSEADIAVNDLIESRLRSATPDYGWLSEESVDDEPRLGKRLTWIVDPIDGTRGYLAGREDWCVSVALVRGCDAGAGGGVRAGHRRILLRRARAGRHAATACRLPRRPAPSWIFPAWRARSRWSNGSTPSSGDIVLHPRIGSLALRLCRVAHGSLDAAFAGGQSRDWDLAAADLIVQEANGSMTALSGDADPLQSPGGDARGAGGSGTRSSCAHCRAFSQPPAALSVLDTRHD